MEGWPGGPSVQGALRAMTWTLLGDVEEEGGPPGQDLDILGDGEEERGPSGQDLDMLENGEEED